MTNEDLCLAWAAPAVEWTEASPVGNGRLGAMVFGGAGRNRVQLNDAKVFDSPIVTTLEPLTEFFPAEAYHQDYVANNPNEGYVRACALPKIDKVREAYGDWLKSEEKN